MVVELVCMMTDLAVVPFLIYYDWTRGIGPGIMVVVGV